MVKKSKMKELIVNAQLEGRVVHGSKPLKSILPICDAEVLDLIGSN